jgi:hypothetical protein
MSRLPLWNKAAGDGKILLTEPFVQFISEDDPQKAPPENPRRTLAGVCAGGNAGVLPLRV